MKLAFATVLAAFVASVSAQAFSRCHDSGIKSKISEGLSIASVLCQQAANRPIANGGKIHACVTFHSDGTTEQTNYHWDLTVRHNGPPVNGVPPAYSDVNQCILAISQALRDCTNNGVITNGGFGWINTNLIEWEIDPDHEDKC